MDQFYNSEGEIPDYDFFPGKGRRQRTGGFTTKPDFKSKPSLRHSGTFKYVNYIPIADQLSSSFTRLSELTPWWESTTTPHHFA
jgi:hypothetical protein